mmetsp:Transcript_20749/g.34733  ORF Transcript_20749/g.34733 Transcript_20749/m.34733 type:complete len:242 (-) Transcript_20749:132-857(-)|eukprot:CAMPEP_0174967128 /NCGR_PEP_ID=MMETSP0004_2-20121128/7414_1 /TAXON_ID=420556 /ORGANISM="Ochromonas sp., Strain CCMP1393" /LENGTH=241 /DNA_ID=CAMNT_0016216231 /DNA_START=153 /DNA_END=878 /DNA_ORIENTATION=-
MSEQKEDNRESRVIGIENDAQDDNETGALNGSNDSSFNVEDDEYLDAGVLVVEQGAPFFPNGEVAEMVRISGTSATEANNFNNALFEMCSIIAYDALAAEQRTDTVSCWKILYIEFEKVVSNFTIPNDNQADLFNFLPNNTWPGSFLDYIQVEKEAPIKTKRFADLAAVKNLPEDQKRMCQFGKLVKDAAERCRSVIINQMNKHYVDSADYKSGKEEPDYMLAIRKAVWPSDCVRKAVSYC